MRWHLRAAWALQLGASLLLSAGLVQAAPGTTSEPPPFAYATLSGAPQDDEFRPDCGVVCFSHLYGTVALGRGLRFNNPYRLSTVLGDDAESLSLTAPYTDISLGALFGDPRGFQQGVQLSTSLALQGVPQQVLAPGYAVAYRLGPRGQLRSSLSLPWVLQPATNVGLDVAAGGAFMVFAGIGLAGSVVFSLYEGAATDQRAATLIPILSFQAGVTVDYEVLP